MRPSVPAAEKDASPASSEADELITFPRGFAEAVEDGYPSQFRLDEFGTLLSLESTFLYRADHDGDECARETARVLEALRAIWSGRDHTGRTHADRTRKALGEAAGKLRHAAGMKRSEYGDVGQTVQAAERIRAELVRILNANAEIRSLRLATILERLRRSRGGKTVLGPDPERLDLRFDHMFNAKERIRTWSREIERVRSSIPPGVVREAEDLAEEIINACARASGVRRPSAAWNASRNRVKRDALKP